MSDADNMVNLVSGLIGVDYYNDRSINDVVLKAQLRTVSTDEVFNDLVSRLRSVIRSMASSDMDLKQAETFLISQTRKHEGGITEDQSKAVQNCWKLHRHRIHESLVEGCIWNSRLRDVSWRIDIKSQFRNVEQVNTSTAIIEVKLENFDLYHQGLEVIRFEIDDDRLAKMHHVLLEIEEQIKKHAESTSALPDF